MTNKELMLDGKLYLANDKELRDLSTKGRRLLDLINETGYTDFEQRSSLFKELFAKTGNNITVNKPFHCDYGSNIYVGENFYANFNLTILDVNKVIIGDDVMMGPNVSIYTAGHPVDPEVRKTGLEFGLEVKIGNNVWVGGNVVINPGLTIGDNTIIASGAVVTKSFGSNLIIGGNPARVIRAIDENDKIKWEAKQKEYESLIK